MKATIIATSVAAYKKVRKNTNKTIANNNTTNRHIISGWCWTNFINLTSTKTLTMHFHKELQKQLKNQIKQKASLEIPPDPALGDAALPCFQLAKTRKKPPQEIAKQLAQALTKPDFVERVEAKGPYVNFYFNKAKIAQKILADIAKQKTGYGTSTKGKNKTIVMDYSHPNIGKPFHFGHLRSTVIGNSLFLIQKSQGYNVQRLNYLGDWGTQFGALIAAFKKWGDEKKLAQNPVEHMQDLYVKFHKAIKEQPELQEEARSWFQKLEQGDEEANAVWAKFRQASLEEFKKIYDLLGVSFDSFDGEAHFARHAEEAIQQCQKKNLTTKSEGALIVSLKGFDVPAMLKKSDGTTTYLSRDLAAALYRLKHYKPEQVQYVVDHGQALHFQQLFEVANKLGFPKKKFVHVDFGLYLSPEGGRMRTRKGKVVFMKDVLEEAIMLARKIIEEKNPKLKNKDETARKIAIGAIFFGDLMNDRNKDITFNLKKILDFEGDTGPYLQYTYARASSIVRKAKTKKLVASTKTKFEQLKQPVEQKLVMHLANYPDIVQQALNSLKPHVIAHYLLSLGRMFNEFYHSCPIIQEKNKNTALARLLLVDCSRTVLKNGLCLLGIETPEEM